MSRNTAKNGSGPAKRKTRIVRKMLIPVLIIVAIVALLTLTACSKDEEVPELEVLAQQPVAGAPGETEQEVEFPVDEAPEPTEPPIHGEITGIDCTNPLTGVTMDKGKTVNRPLLISLANTADAHPLNGISEADILYEFLVEGGITRFLALYQDFTDVAKVGCIRSARHYTVEIAQSYDGILLTAGGSPQALSYVRSSGVPHLNEVEGPRREVFYRDRNRISGRRMESMHSVVTTNERLLQWLPKYDFRLTHEEDFETALNFTENGTPTSGSTANRVVARFSAGKTTTFTYNSDKKVYRVNQFNRELTDANNGANPEFTNILILKTSVRGIPGDEAGRQNVLTTGEGEGYFVCGGKFTEIKWSRQNNASQYVYTNKDGSDLELGVGRTFICIIPTTMDADFS